MDRSSESATRSRITTLLTNAQLGRLERLRINASRCFTRRSAGEHLSGRSGNSNEFADYRNYVTGDDIRRIDWNIFSRLREPYIKLFYEEQEMHVAIIIDNSASMAFEGKFERARQLAAAFAFMGLMGGEHVSVYATNGGKERGQRLEVRGQGGKGKERDKRLEIRDKSGEEKGREAENKSGVYCKPLRGRANFPKIAAFLEGLRAGGDCMIEAGISGFLKRHYGRGMVLVLSDFMSCADLEKPFNRLFAAGLENFSIQLLGPTELAPAVSDDLRLVDCETGENVDISSGGYLLELYTEYLDGFSARLSQLCKQRLGRYQLCNTEDSFSGFLFDELLRRGWVQ